MTQAEPPHPADATEPEEVDPGQIAEIIEARRDAQGGMIAILQEVQQRCGYLPEQALRQVAEQTGRSLVDVYGLVTFYRSFSLAPRGRHVVSACLGTACHVRGAARVVEELKAQLDIEAGQTTSDRQFTLETVNCLGACALGPVVVIDGHYFSKVTTSRVRSLLADAVAGFAAGEPDDDRVFPITVSCPRCNHSLMDPDVWIDGLPSIRCTVSLDGRGGCVRISALYGSAEATAEPEVPAGAVAAFYCPHCHAQLAGPSACPACDAPMVPMMIQGGGIVQICSRSGCGQRVLDLI